MWKISATVFAKLNKMDKTLAQQPTSRKKTLLDKAKYKTRDVVTNVTEIQRIIIGYFKQLYVSKLENIDRMGRFLDTKSLSKLRNRKTQNDRKTQMIINPGRYYTSSSLPTKKSPGNSTITVFMTYYRDVCYNQSILVLKEI